MEEQKNVSSDIRKTRAFNRAFFMPEELFIISYKQSISTDLPQQVLWII